jgi:hypothetical protein
MKGGSGPAFLIGCAPIQTTGVRVPALVGLFFLNNNATKVGTPDHLEYEKLRRVIYNRGIK